MHEIKVLITVAGVSLLIIFFTVRFFMKRADARGQDSSIALRNGLLVSLALFALFIMYYEDTREKKVVEGVDSEYCKKNPWDCAEPPAITR
jgi:hypothetical protein